MNQGEFLAARRAKLLQQKSDQLFAACLHFLIDKDEYWLPQITQLSQELLDHGYETSFEHKKKALLVRNMFTQQLETITAATDDRLAPRRSDVEGLPDAS